MIHRIATAFRRILPALFLLLPPVAAFSFATSQAPAAFPTTAPVRVSDPQRIPDDDDPASVARPGTSAPSVPSGPVKITVTPAPFLSITAGDQIVREFIVQNDSAKPVDVTIVMNYAFGWRGDRATRSFTTSRKIPANSIQTVSVFVPSSLLENSFNSIDVVDPRIYVDGRRYNPLPPGIFDIGDMKREYFSAPSSFDTTRHAFHTVFSEEAVLTPLVHGIRTKYIDSYGGYNASAQFSVSDTIQWPSIPQFYQAKDLIFRKTTDKFTPDAERAIRDAVMLGATEVLFVAEGTRAPEWVPAPEYPGVPVIVPRGFGRTIVIDERLFASAPEVSRQNTAPAEGMPDPDAVDEWKRTGTRPNAALERMISGMIQPTVDYLKNADLFIVNPAAVCQMLPCVDIPNVSFAVVILALLAYIVVVGPVNYFYLIRHKKSVLLLLLTVPVISFVFVGIVIVFVTLFEGWYTRASAVGMTFLDQQENMAYTRAAVSLYAPIPVRRLVFDPSDTVSFARAKDANISLGRDQVVTGANKARVPLVYGVSRAEKHLEQLKVSRNAAGTLTVVNGLGAPVKVLAMKTPDGKLWLPSDGIVPPGASAELKPYTGTEPPGAAMKAHFANSNGNFAKEVTSSFSPGRNQLFYTVCAYLLEPGGDKSTGNAAREATNGLFSHSSAISFRHDALAAVQEEGGVSPLAACLAPGMYVVETDRPLFYTPGCNPVSFRARHLVVGTFTLQE